jgi:hypothetical protein
MTLAYLAGCSSGAASQQASLQWSHLHLGSKLGRHEAWAGMLLTHRTFAIFALSAL